MRMRMRTCSYAATLSLSGVMRGVYVMRVRG